MKKIAFFFLFFTFTALSFAENGSSGNFSVAIIKDSTLNIVKNDKTGRFKLNHSISGYKTNCKRNYIAAWGKPLKINRNNPQDSSLTIISLRPIQKKFEIFFDKNIYEVNFLKDETSISIDSDLEKIINIKNGRDTSPPIDSDPKKEKLSQETCEDFKFKSFSKFKN
jgi:hypothetical protein